MRESESERKSGMDAKKDEKKETTEEEPTPAISPEKTEEVKLRQKFPNLVKPGVGGGSAFLQKRLQHKQKYFDSGDYNLAKAKGLKLSPFGKPAATASSKLAVVVDSDDTGGSTSPTGCEIPTPQSVPQRKSSIIAPEVASKLSPHPLLYHSQLTASQESN